MREAMPEPYFISTERRNLFLRIVDNYPAVDEIALRLHFLDNHFPPQLLDSALKWLIANRVTGRKFVYWFKEDRMGSDLEVHRFLLRVVENQKGTLHVIAGKNFKA